MPDFGIMRGFGDKLFSDKLVAGQLPTKLGLTQSISVFDTDAVAFFNRVTNAGGTLTLTEQLAVNQLVLDMKSAGIWTSMKAVYPMVGASSAACKQNLKSSSFTGTFTTGWTFASTGVTPNGTSAYMDTGFAIGGNLILPSIHLTYYSRTNNAIAGGPTEIGVGSGGGAAYYELNVRRSSTFSTILSDGFTITATASNTDSSGFYLANRTSNNNLNIWKNGNKLSTITTLATFLSIPTNNIFIGAEKDGTQATSNFSNRQCAFASIGDGLTDTQASNHYIAVQAFQTTLSRQV